MKISVSSSRASSSPSSALGPALGPAAAASPGEAGPGSGVSMVGSSACSMSHSMA